MIVQRQTKRLELGAFGNYWAVSILNLLKQLASILLYLFIYAKEFVTLSMISFLAASLLLNSVIKMLMKTKQKILLIFKILNVYVTALWKWTKININSHSFKLRKTQFHTAYRSKF